MNDFSNEPGVELRELFFETAQELLQALNDDALMLEKQPDSIETMRSIRRTVHTLKGDAAACGFRELSELAHEFEDALATEAVPSNVSLAEVAFSAADTFSSMLQVYRQGGTLPTLAPVKKLIRELTASPSGKKVKKVKPDITTAVNWTEYEKVAIEEAGAKGQGVSQVTVQIDPFCAMPMAARQLVFMALSKIGDVLGCRPEAGMEATSKQLTFLVASDEDFGAVASKCQIPTIISEVQIQILEPLKTTTVVPGSEGVDLISAAISPTDTVHPTPPVQVSTLAAEKAEIPPSQINGSGSENTLRVDSDRIDAVLNLVGELIIGKSMLQQALNELAVLHPKEAIRGKFADAMAFQSRVLGDLQRSVMKVRMVPVDQLFRRFPRMVRDVAKRCGKNVELTMKGQETDLDKSLLDAIAEPLTHIVRNAVSHGIESSEERKKKGKPEQGTIRLEAYHHANHVIVSVSDDGGGIDLQKVRQKALKQGIISAAEAAQFSDPEIMDLVFRPGFTTADEVTEVSGRGVGLDVARNILQRLKGTVEIETRVGEGTIFRLKLPLTLAIIKALLFSVEKRLYAIPLNAVAEIARAYESDLHRVESYEVLQLRNQVLPIVRMGRSGQDRIHHAGKIFVLIIAFGERKLGLIVDSLEGEEELVIKALDDHTVTTDLVGGASILGDGRVVLIMNLAAIVERFSQSRLEQNSVLATSGLLLSQTERVQFAAGVGR